MSGLLAGKVWLSNLDPRLKPLAATIADIGDDDGTAIYPSVAYIAWRLGISERSVQRGLSDLIDMGILKFIGLHNYQKGISKPAADSEENVGRGWTREYRLIEARLPSRPPWNKERKGDKLSPFREVGSCGKGDTQDAKGCQPRCEKVTAASPESSLSVSEPSEPARSEIAESEGAQRKNPQKRANRCPIETSNKNALRANVSRLAKSKSVSHLNPHRSSETVHLEAGIFRHYVSAAYFDSVHNGLSHKEGFGEALDQAIRSLLSNRGAVELRGVHEESLHAATWTRLAAFVEPLAQISDYSRRENQVVSTIVRVVCEEALRLTTSKPESTFGAALHVETRQPTAAAVNG